MKAAKLFTLLSFREREKIEKYNLMIFCHCFQNQD